jgi:hypothetical protein
MWHVERALLLPRSLIRRGGSVVGECLSTLPGYIISDKRPSFSIHTSLSVFNYVTTLSYISILPFIFMIETLPAFTSAYNTFLQIYFTSTQVLVLPLDISVQGVTRGANYKNLSKNGTKSLQ